MTRKDTRRHLLTRRRTIQGLLSIPIVSAFRPVAALASAPPIDAILHVSSLLCAIPLDRSYIQLGQSIWAALMKGASAQERADWQRLIRQLRTLPPHASERRIKNKLASLAPETQDKAKTLARVWYTGRIRHANGTQDGTYEVIDYDDALVWIACDFTKPPTTCGGHFGYWQNPYMGGA